MVEINHGRLDVERDASGQWAVTKAGLSHPQGRDPRLIGTGFEDFPPVIYPEWLHRFLAKIDRSAPDGCWLWTSNKLPAGYGQFFMGRKVSPKYAHRLAYELWRGPIPEGLFVLHSCDNPSCVNPGHLRLGTQQDNMDDRRAKGWYLKQREVAE